MEFVKKEKVRCQFHPKEGILRINTEVGAEKELYCIECLMDTKNTSELIKTLKHVEEFIDIAANYYQSSKETSSTDSGEIPEEYSDLIESQNSKFSDLEAQIENQKKTITLNYEELIKQILKFVTKKRDEQIAMLDKQLFNYRQGLIYFQKQVNKSYIGSNDDSAPTKEQIVEKFEKITNYAQLLAYVRGIKEDMNEKASLNSGLEIELTVDEARKFQLKRLYKEINEISTKTPNLKLNKTSEETFSSISSQIEKSLNTMFVLENEIPDITVGVKLKCSAEKGGVSPVEENAYFCSNCNMTVCKGCKTDCHKGHSVEDEGKRFFTCDCQFKNKDCTKLSTCSFAYTKRSYYSQIAWMCATCNMQSGNCLCTHCSKVCHKGHQVNSHWSSSCFCDCYDLFSFCSLKKKGWKP